MKPGDGWYLFRCGRCKDAFIGTSMVEWCDCGNTHFEHLRYGIKIEVEFNDKMLGSLVVWDSRNGDNTAIPKSKEISLLFNRACELVKKFL